MRKLLIIGLICLLAQYGFGSCFVQADANEIPAASGLDVSRIYPGSVVAGHRGIAVCGFWTNDYAVSFGVTDTQLNTWTPIGDTTLGTDVSISEFFFFTTIFGSSGADTVKCSGSGSGVGNTPNEAIFITEYPALSINCPTECQFHNSGITTTSITDSITTSRNSLLLAFLLKGTGDASSSVSSPGGYTVEFNGAGIFTEFLADKPLVGAGAQSVTITTGATQVIHSGFISLYGNIPGCALNSQVAHRSIWE
jgi:hypothetical protein